MPLKFKLYFACACYLLLWSGFWLIDNFCDIIFKSNTGTSGYVLIMLAMLVFILISIVSIRMILHYRSATHPTANGKLLFITSHGFNIGAVLILTGVLFFSWMEGLGSYNDDIYVQLTLQAYINFCLIAGAWMTCLTLLVLSPALSKAVRDRYNTTHDIKISF